ncbi:cytidine/uridine monophosphate kinase Dak1 isoform X2 [Calliopsis andreniformis]|uniref:cytidine/uridine monophosphate kinase Dak1 isoform X2 n=1 Tax=Calliopsis andreniformis TaxID=337506 RepID=UPI003FCE9396
MLKILVAGLRFFRMSAVQKPEVLFVLGGPGAAGDLLREERAKPGSQYGELIENHITNGTIVPVAITCSLLDRAMQTSDNPHKRFFIDGFPRNQDNVDGWNEAMSDKCIVKGVLFCDCNKETCVQRCLKRGAAGSGRSDDNEKVLEKRHKTYITDTLPIIQHFEKQNLVFKVDGMQSPEKVFEDAVKILTQIGW